MIFKRDFIWGAATAAYQVEGASNQDGRSPSVWDTFCDKPGVVVGGDTGRVACDHYNRYPEDFAIMADLGIQSYRFSFSWSRILPDGTGRINPLGVEFYDRYIDSLLEKGITPFPTIFHWDYPEALFERGGWLNPESVEWFGEYTQLLTKLYSDRIENWWTLNEPPCFLGLGHRIGTHAPGVQLDWPDFFLTVKHALMAHGRATQILRDTAHQTPTIGFVPISHIAVPADERPENIEAAREFTFGVQPLDRQFWFSRLYLDPIVIGEWPEECIRVLTDDGPRVTAAELELMSQPIDLLGLNYYAAPVVRRGENGEVEAVPFGPGHPRSTFDWDVVPEGLYWSVRFHHERYGLPMVIAENGIAGREWVSEDGKVHDPQRIDYVSRHLAQLHRAEQEGLPIQGYFHWSLLDNFEWAEGYRYRFGLVHVDFQTQKRTPKDSAYWFRDVIARNGLVPVAEPAPKFARVGGSLT